MDPPRRGRVKPCKGGGDERRDLENIYGGFHDIASYRLETGDTQASDADINQMLLVDYENIQLERERESKASSIKEAEAQRLLNEATRRAENERLRAEAEKGRADAERSRADAEKGRFPNYGDLEYERMRRRLAESTLYPKYDILNTANFIEKERIKNELKKELENDMKKELEKEAKPVVVKIVRQSAPKKATKQKATPKKATKQKATKQKATPKKATKKKV
jgi:hypothetical protein